MPKDINRLKSSLLLCDEWLAGSAKPDITGSEDITLSGECQGIKFENIRMKTGIDRYGGRVYVDAEDELRELIMTEMNLEWWPRGFYYLIGGDDGHLTDKVIDNNN